MLAEPTVASEALIYSKTERQYHVWMLAGIRVLITKLSMLADRLRVQAPEATRVWLQPPSPSAFVALASLGSVPKNIVSAWTGCKTMIPPHFDCPAEEASAFDTGRVQMILRQFGMAAKPLLLDEVESRMLICPVCGLGGRDRIFVSDQAHVTWHAVRHTPPSLSGDTRSTTSDSTGRLEDSGVPHASHAVSAEKYLASLCAA